MTSDSAIELDSALIKVIRRVVNALWAIELVSDRVRLTARVAAEFEATLPERVRTSACNRLVVAECPTELARSRAAPNRRPTTVV